MSICILPEHRDLFDAMGERRYEQLLAPHKRAVCAIENADPDPVLGDRIVSLKHIGRIAMATTEQIIASLNKCAKWRVCEWLLFESHGEIQAIVLPWSRRGDMPRVLARITGVRVIQPSELHEVLSPAKPQRRATA